MCSHHCHVKCLHKKKSDLALVGEPLTGNLFYRVKEKVTSLPCLYLKKIKKMTQSSPLIGRHAYFLKEKVNNKILSRILNAETAPVFMIKLKQYEKMFSKLKTEQSTQQGSVTEFAEF